MKNRNLNHRRTGRLQRAHGRRSRASCAQRHGAGGNAGSTGHRRFPGRAGLAQLFDFERHRCSDENLASITQGALLLACGRSSRRRTQAYPQVVGITGVFRAETAACAEFRALAHTNALPRPGAEWLDTLCRGGSASTGAGCGRSSCAQP